MKRLLGGWRRVLGTDRDDTAPEPRNSLTVEDVETGDTAVMVWAVVDGVEYPSMTIPPGVARALAADLTAKADLLDPPTTAVRPC